MNVGFYPLAKLPVELLQCLNRIWDTFPVPTEMVVDDYHNIPPPQQGRIYYTDYVWHNKTVKFLRDAHEPDPDCKGLVLCEVWHNFGDDGHTGFRLVGFRLCAEESINTKAHFYKNMPDYAVASVEDRDILDEVVPWTDPLHS